MALSKKTHDFLLPLVGLLLAAGAIFFIFPSAHAYAACAPGQTCDSAGQTCNYYLPTNPNCESTLTCTAYNTSSLVTVPQTNDCYCMQTMEITHVDDQTLLGGNASVGFHFVVRQGSKTTYQQQTQTNSLLLFNSGTQDNRYGQYGCNSNYQNCPYDEIFDYDLGECVDYSYFYYGYNNYDNGLYIYSNDNCGWWQTFNGYSCVNNFGYCTSDSDCGYNNGYDEYCDTDYGVHTCVNYYNNNNYNSGSVQVSTSSNACSISSYICGLPCSDYAYADPTCTSLLNAKCNLLGLDYMTVDTSAPTCVSPGASGAYCTISLYAGANGQQLHQISQTNDNSGTSEDCLIDPPVSCAAHLSGPGLTNAYIGTYPFDTLPNEDNAQDIVVNNSYFKQQGTYTLNVNCGIALPTGSTACSTGCDTAGTTVSFHVDTCGTTLSMETDKSQYNGGDMVDIDGKVQNNNIPIATTVFIGVYNSTGSKVAGFSTLATNLSL